MNEQEIEVKLYVRDLKKIELRLRSLKAQLIQSRNLAGALGNLGTVLVRQGNYTSTLELFLQGMETHRNTGYRYGIAIALDNVGTAHFHLGNEREAHDIKADFIALDALVWVAMLCAKRGETENALEFFSLIRHHPKTDPETIQSIEELLPQILDGLREDEVREAEERGKMRELADVIADILSDQ